MATLKASKFFREVNEILRRENCFDCNITFNDENMVLELDNGVIVELDYELR